MLHVTTERIDVVAFPFDIAETKVHQVVDLARARDAAAELVAEDGMLSAELEQAIRQALDDATERGHEFSGLEHLLLALMGDEKTAEVIKHCGGSVKRLQDKLEEFLEKEIKPLPEDQRDRAQPTLGFARVVQRAVNHVIGAGKSEANGPNALVALYSEPDSHAVAFLKEEGITRLDVVSYISHGISKLLPAKTPNAGGQGSRRQQAQEEEGEEAPADPLAAYAVNLNERARAGEIDPLIGREREVERAIQVLARRRKNNPLFVGDAGVGKTAIVEGLARRIELGEAPEAIRGAEIYALDMGALVAGTRSAATSRTASRRCSRRSEKRRRDSLHRRDPHDHRRGRGERRHAGRVEPAEARAGSGQAPLHRRDDVRGVPQPPRARPRARAALPEDRGRRAERRRDHGDPEGAAARATRSSTA